MEYVEQAFIWISGITSALTLVILIASFGQIVLLKERVSSLIVPDREIKVLEAVTRPSPEHAPEFLILNEGVDVSNALINFDERYEYMVRVHVKLRDVDEWLQLEEHTVKWEKPHPDRGWLMIVDEQPVTVTMTLVLNLEASWRHARLSMAQISGRTSTTQFAMW